jgi:ATPase family associated with various cellular activities (AAA)
MSRNLENFRLRIQAGTPLTWVRTSEPERAVNAVIAVLHGIRGKLRDQLEKNPADNEGMEVPGLVVIIPHKGAYIFDEENGLVKSWPVEQPAPVVGMPPVMPAVPTNAGWLDILAYNQDNTLEPEPAFQLPQNAYVVVSEAEDIFRGFESGPQGPIAKLEFRCRPPVSQLDGREVQALNSMEMGRQIIFVGINPELLPATERIRRFMHVEEFKRPNQEEICCMIREEFPESSGYEFEHHELERAAQLLRGLTMTEAREAVLFSMMKTKKLEPICLREETKRMIERHPAITMPEFDETWDELIGLCNAKGYIEAGLNESVPEQFRPGAILLTGIPGGGKSHLGKALGRKLGLPTLQINIGRVFGSLVGQTERQMEDLIQLLDAIGPFVGLLEELEKAVGGMNGSAGDGGISRRVFGVFLNWMQDRKKGGIIFGTSNDLSGLPAEFTRQGRWSVKFFVDYPSSEEREKIGKLYCDKWHIQAPPGYFANECDQWTGSEIRDLVTTAGMFGGEPDSLATARKYISPLITSDPEKVEEIRKKGSALPKA